jgi:hypothetical protein
VKSLIRPRKLGVESLESRQMLATIFSEPLDVDPGWASSGEWAFGHPTGGGKTTLSYGDPADGWSGANVYGVNLNGGYSFAVSGGDAHYLQTNAINCTGYHRVHLSFYQKLNTDRFTYASATVDVSSDNATWHRIYANADAPVTDSNWMDETYDIGAYADNQATVYIRWGYQLISTAAPYSGWNIDDVKLTGTSAPTSTWDGGSLVNNLWTTAANWVGDVAPTAGSYLVFPNQDHRKESVNDFPTTVRFDSIEVDGSGYFFHGTVVVNDFPVHTAVLRVDSVVADTLTVGLPAAAASRPRGESSESRVRSDDAPAVAITRAENPCVVNCHADPTIVAKYIAESAEAGEQHIVASLRASRTLPSTIVPNDLDASTPVVIPALAPPPSFGVEATFASAKLRKAADLTVTQFELLGGHAIAASVTDPGQATARVELLAKRLAKHYVDSPVAPLAAVERAFEDYRPREVLDRAIRSGLPDRQAGRADKSFEEAADAFLAADWAW